ncbi:sulfotransferase [Marivirga lumbricoides]|uniref:Sulfotransferase n=1 Tax=Marivirga lumbricoides TaxID=1046115 RepID=A0ABQ1LR50_9BACT|nr:sulfotransferase [Marivirga lumbricoides]
MILPDFIIIGAMKCGTTSIFKNLAQHSQIYGHPAKEINFFSEKYHLGMEWYSAKFKEGFVNGESSPNYTKRDEYVDTAKLIHECNPKMKLIYVVRDPIKRMISHLHHDLYRDRLKISQISSALEEDNKYVNTSKYAYQIEPYLKYFSLENILFLQFEDYLENPQLVMNKICSFLSISAYDFTIGKFNTTEKKYWIKNFDQIKRLQRPTLRKVYHLLFYFINRKIKRPALDDQTYRSVKDRLVKDMEEFEKISGIGFKL